MLLLEHLFLYEVVICPLTCFFPLSGKIFGTYRVSIRRPIGKIFKVDILHYFTFLIITEQIRNIFEFWGTGVFFGKPCTFYRVQFQSTSSTPFQFPSTLQTYLHHNHLPWSGFEFLKVLLGHAARRLNPLHRQLPRVEHLPPGRPEQVLLSE